MRNLKFTKILLGLMLILGLTTSSFAMSHGGKPDKGNNKVKIEQKIHNNSKNAIHHKDVHKKDVTIVKVYNDSHHHKPHHNKHHDKFVYYNNSSDVAAMAIGTGLCLAMIAAINS